jgi:uncharacterized membrane protein YbhN (UPF0104 family)
MEEYAAPIPAGQVSLRQKVFSIKTGLSFLIGFVALYFLVSRIDLSKTLITIKRGNTELFFLGFLVFYFSRLLGGSEQGN